MFVEGLFYFPSKGKTSWRCFFFILLVFWYDRCIINLKYIDISDLIHVIYNIKHMTKICCVEDNQMVKFGVELHGILGVIARSCAGTLSGYLFILNLFYFIDRPPFHVVIPWTFKTFFFKIFNPFSGFGRAYSVCPLSPLFGFG